MKADPEKCLLFAAFVVMAAASLTAGVAGFFSVPGMVARRMERIRGRGLEKYVVYLAALLRVLFVLLALISSYLLTKIPAVYRCVFK